jgi:hypothetical protein
MEPKRGHSAFQPLIAASANREGEKQNVPFLSPASANREGKKQNVPFLSPGER